MIREKAVARRDEPDYAQLTGHIPKELVTQLKIFVAQSNFNLSECVEMAVMLLLSAIEKGEPLPQPSETEDRRFRDSGK